MNEKARLYHLENKVKEQILTIKRLQFEISKLRDILKAIEDKCNLFERSA